eukprot:14159256-Alexandrium_andersonii.AAC.1
MHLDCLWPARAVRLASGDELAIGRQGQLQIQVGTIPHQTVRKNLVRSAVHGALMDTQSEPVVPVLVEALGGYLSGNLCEPVAWRPELTEQPFCSRPNVCSVRPAVHPSPPKEELPDCNAM